MPASLLTVIPHIVKSMEMAKVSIKTSSTIAKLSHQLLSIQFELLQEINKRRRFAANHLPTWTGPFYQKIYGDLLEISQDGANTLIELIRNKFIILVQRFHHERQGELEFISLFTDELPRQDWITKREYRKELMDLPGLKLIDISVNVPHEIKNYTVVFAPRAGHHSNIAEQVAVSMRDQGMTRMAIVEQKCAEDIPLFVNGKRHHEDFVSQIEQYRQILEHVRMLTGRPAHLVAICQPGPLLMMTLILYPELGKTLGTAGSPMHTEGEHGYLTDFARKMGENYIDYLITLFGYTVPEGRMGAGRRCYDGRLQVLGFYLLGMEKHINNFKTLLADLKNGNRRGAERQKIFYQWYNYAHHFPASFIRDTYKKIFVHNELIRGTLDIGGRKIGIKDYPAGIPIWAIGGTEDDIAPPLQATGHMDLIDNVAPEDKLTLICKSGHMGLFRSATILRDYYSRVVRFLLDHSDRQVVECN